MTANECIDGGCGQVQGTIKAALCEGEVRYQCSRAEARLLVDGSRVENAGPCQEGVIAGLCGGGGDHW